MSPLCLRPLSSARPGAAKSTGEHFCLLQFIGGLDSDFKGGAMGEVVADVQHIVCMNKMFPLRVNQWSLEGESMYLFRLEYWFVLFCFFHRGLVSVILTHVS